MFEEIGVSYEEEKMLSLAIKNSIREQKSSSAKDFSKVKEMVTYHPTEEEFRDPIQYIEGLFEEGAWKYGWVKIIPPESFKPEFSFDTQSDAKLPTRFQTLQDLSQGKVGYPYPNFQQESVISPVRLRDNFLSLPNIDLRFQLALELWN